MAIFLAHISLGTMWQSPKKVGMESTGSQSRYGLAGISYSNDKGLVGASLSQKLIAANYDSIVRIALVGGGMTPARYDALIVRFVF